MTDSATWAPRDLCPMPKRAGKRRSAGGRPHAATRLRLSSPRDPVVERIRPADRRWPSRSGQEGKDPLGRGRPVQSRTRSEENPAGSPLGQSGRRRELCGRQLSVDSLAARGRSRGGRVAGAMGPDARRRDAGDAGASLRSGNAADGPIPPQPKGRQGVTAHLLRCSSSTMSRIDSSSRLACVP